ncbi:sensor histidine kinase [Nocardia sp. NPDC006044]|uniref:sensor histidine kinase n=1 Tax=Nocardia sp. NPDC006044 TaxID=3364306 RepID=UPI0036B1563C
MPAGAYIAPTTPNRLLRLAGVAAMVVLLRDDQLARQGVAILIMVGIAGLALLVWAVGPMGRPWVSRSVLGVMAICSGLTVAQVGGSLVPLLAAAFAGVAVVQHSVTFGALIIGVEVIAVGVSSVAAHHTPSAYLGLLAGVLLVALMGLSRRQFRVTAEQNRLLVEQSREIRAERDRAATLAERGRIAREVHDVLAHTLGGLVLQLDAADALLEAGETERAADRVRASRELAVSGLDDARQVVGALRAERIDLPAEFERLTTEHRNAGGRVTMDLSGDAEQLGEQVRVALLRGVQESLTNARKHAPGAEVELRLSVGAEQAELVASNPLADRSGLLSASGMGAGLLGMRERIGALGGTVEAGKAGDRWTVRMTVPRR